MINCEDLRRTLPRAQIFKGDTQFFELRSGFQSVGGRISYHKEWDEGAELALEDLRLFEVAPGRIIASHRPRPIEQPPKPNHAVMPRANIFRY